jgi:transposase-like protein
VVDGYHRHTALLAILSLDPKAAILDRVPIRIVAKGDDDRAAWLALAANLVPGCRPRSREDKRRVVALALEHPFAGDTSQADLAAQCGVSVDLVASVRAERRGAPSPKVEATARAEEAVAAAPPGESARATAKRAGVGETTVRRAKERAAAAPVTGNPQQAHPTKPAKAKVATEPPPEPALPGADAYQAIATMLRSCRLAVGPHLEAIAHHDRQALEDGLRKLLWLAERGEPVPCPLHTDECETCGGKGWLRAGDVLDAQRRAKR